LESRKRKMQTKAKCPMCGIDLEEDDCYDTAFYDDSAVRYVVGNCPNCGTAYQWTEHYNYAGAEGVTKC
jgi:endogenous inhibitor of DNA gyrase (YacG/DUF329 family)